MNRINVFILCAGLGERLRPITDHIPKPLIPILGRPILDLLLEKVLALRVNRIGINLHHKKEEIETWLSQSAPMDIGVEIFREELILGTGGALKNAGEFLRDRRFAPKGIFLVHNSDILSDIDLEDIINFHISSGNIGTIAVHDCPEFNNVAIDEKGILKGVGKDYPDETKFVAFTGIAVYSPEFLRFLPEGISSVVDGWLKAVASGYRIGSIDVSGSYWRDVGTPGTYVDAVIDSLRNDGERIYIHPTAQVSRDAYLDGYVVIEKGCVVNKGISLRNCILLPGTEINENSYHENCILGKEYEIGVDISRWFAADRLRADAFLVGTGGSDRNYYRVHPVSPDYIGTNGVKRNDRTAILMESRKDDPDFERHVEYTHFFQSHSIPVPMLLEADYDKKNAFFEDLGDLSLYTYLKCPRKEEDIERIYRGLIDILISLHTTVTRHISKCPLLKERVFDYEHLRWETGYFIERFVKGIRNINIKNFMAIIEDEFHRLAMRVDSFQKTVIHRDFQSQNIMVTKNGVPRVVDYQGARIGPPAYDLASILWDPYYRLTDGLRKRLIDYYMQGRKVIPDEKFNERDFMETLLPCRLQRHMQALGAYGFLSMVKGKKYFLKYVPEGLRLLKEDTSLSKGEYPELFRLVMEL